MYIPFALWIIHVILIYSALTHTQRTRKIHIHIHIHTHIHTPSDLCCMPSRFIALSRPLKSPPLSGALRDSWLAVARADVGSAGSRVRGGVAGEVVTSCTSWRKRCQSRTWTYVLRMRTYLLHECRHIYDCLLLLAKVISVTNVNMRITNENVFTTHM